MATNNRYIKQALTTVDFSSGSGETRPRHYVFEMDDRVDLEQYANGAVRVRRYPSEAPTITGAFGGGTIWDSLIYNAIKGTVVFTQEVREREVFGSLEFTGNDRIKLPYPQGTLPANRIQSPGLGGTVSTYAGNIEITRVGQFYNLYGMPINVTLIVDLENSEIVASQPCYGEAEYRYITDYRILRYLPRSYKDLYGALVWGADDYGSILAQYRVPFQLTPEGRVISEPPPPIVFKVTPPDNHNLEWELYRIESAVIVNEDGTWERPMEWPSSGVFEDSTDTLDPNAPHLEVKRLHEVAMFSLQERETFTRLNNSKYFDVPLQYGRQERRVAGAARDVSTEPELVAMSFSSPPQQYIDRIKNFRQPKMRVSWYEQPLQKPYEKHRYARTPSELQKYAGLPEVAWPKSERRAVSVVMDAKAGTIKYNNLSRTFKIKLSITAGRPPAGSTTTLSYEDRNKTDAELQEQLLNRELRRAWDAIDWLAVRKSILARYPTTQFQLTFDSTFPQTDNTQLAYPPPARGYV